MRRLPLIVGVLLLGLAWMSSDDTDAGAPDWQSQYSQTLQNPYWLTQGDSLTTYTHNLTAQLRAFIVGADTSDADNQFDAVGDAVSGAFVFDVDRDGAFSIYRIDGADVLVETAYKMFGDYGAKDAVDDTTLANDAVTTDKILDDAVTLAKVADAAIGTAQIVDGAVDSNKIGVNAISTANIDSLSGAKINANSVPATALDATTGGRFDFAASGDSIEAQVGLFAKVSPVSGGPLEIDAFDAIGNTRITLGTFDVVVGKASFDGDIDLGDGVSDQITVYGDITTREDMVFGISVTDTAGFTGPATFHDGINLDSYLWDKDAKRDSMGISLATMDTVLVENVSDIIADGKYCHCFATWNFNFFQAVNEFGGTGYRRTIIATPFSQTAGTGDSVLVVIDANIVDVEPYVVRCIATE